jgi:hypothetical protein
MVTMEAFMVTIVAFIVTIVACIVEILSFRVASVSIIPPKDFCVFNFPE